MIYTDLNGRGEPPLPKWDHPRRDEPAHGFFVRLAGLNGQISASALASSFGLNGRVLQPSECLDFALSFPIDGKERLHSATPIICNTAVKMFGETLRRRDWSIGKRNFCAGCLAEDAYHRSFWDLVAFRRCPFHDQPLCCIDRSGHPVPWWSPSFERSPFGSPIAERQERASVLAPSVELYLLGRLGLTEKLPIPLLDDFKTLASLFAAIEFAGTLALGGFRKTRPSLKLLGHGRALNAGFDMLRAGNERISCTLRDLAANAEDDESRKGRSLQLMFGWAYRAAKDSSLGFGTTFTDRMIEVAATRNGLARRDRYLERAKARIQLADAGHLSEELGMSETQVRTIARGLGLRGAWSRYYFAFSDEEARLIRSTSASLVSRDEAANMLDVSRRFFDSLIESRILRRFVRFQGNGGDHFRREDIESFGQFFAEKANKLDVVPPTGRLLRDVKRTAKTNPAHLVRQLIAGTLPILGRVGETVGTIIIPRPTPRSRNHARSDPVGITIIDAATALGIDRPAVVALRRLGYLRSSKYLPKLLDSRGVETFHKKYCAARYYAPILKCHTRLAGRLLADLGVKAIQLDRVDGATRLIDRASARRALGLRLDPDEFCAGSRQAFISGLAAKIRAATTFSLVSQSDCLVFRTGRGSLRLYVTIDWKRHTLEVGPRYSLRGTPSKIAELRRRQSTIDAAFSGELIWAEVGKSLHIYQLIKKLPFGSPDRWGTIYVQMVELFSVLKRHFEPPQWRRDASMRAATPCRLVETATRSIPPSH